jgi:tRNA(fMet)-specific endonuclease VapC
MTYPPEAAEAYGRLRAYLKKQGRLLGPLDMLIAAHAIYLNCTLVTNNTAEFSRCPDLRIENWIS